MANPENLKHWQSGQSGNPAGTTKKRRLAAAFHRFLDEKGLEGQLCLLIYAKAVGNKKALGDLDPDLAWMNLALDLLHGDEKPVKGGQVTIDVTPENAETPLSGAAAQLVAEALAIRDKYTYKEPEGHNGSGPDVGADS